jgi:hypothetical protein
MKRSIVCWRLEKKSIARAFAANEVTEGVPTGMVIDEIEDDGETIANTPVVMPKRVGARKTKQQRARKAKQKVEVRFDETFDCGGDRQSSRKQKHAFAEKMPPQLGQSG